jgi:signal transduction histidine kinase
LATQTGQFELSHPRMTGKLIRPARRICCAAIRQREFMITSARRSSCHGWCVTRQVSPIHITIPSRVPLRGIRLDGPHDFVAVYVDPDRFVQVMTNLLSNAIKFSPPGEVVVVAMEKRGDDVHFTVRDRGLGIPAEFRPRIFKTYLRPMHRPTAILSAKKAARGWA